MDGFNLKENNNSDARSQKVTRLPLTSDYVFKRIFARGKIIVSAQLKK